MSAFSNLSKTLFFCLLICSCKSNPWLHLQHSSTISSSNVAPQIGKALYRCTVDGKFVVKKFHLSGLLYIKEMPDASTRILFQNEMGLGFFDFSFLENDSFVVHKVMEQMDKPALIKTLEKDFSMLLMKGIDSIHFLEPTIAIDHAPSSPFIVGYYQQAPVYYFQKLKNSTVYDMENWSARKKIVSITSKGYSHPKGLGDSITIQHHRAKFTIQLNRLSDAAVEE